MSFLGQEEVFCKFRGVVFCEGWVNWVHRISIYFTRNIDYLVSGLECFISVDVFFLSWFNIIRNATILYEHSSIIITSTSSLSLAVQFIFTPKDHKYIHQTTSNKEIRDKIKANTFQMIDQFKDKKSMFLFLRIGGQITFNAHKYFFFSLCFRIV